MIPKYTPLILNISLAVLFLTLFSMPAFSEPADELVLQRLQTSTKLNGADEILADFHKGESETRVIISLQPSAEAGTLAAESLHSGMMPEEFNKPGAPTYYNLQDMTIRKRLRETVQEQVSRVIRELGNTDITVTNKFNYQFGFSARVTPAGLEKIVNNPDVLLVEKDRLQKKQLAQGIPLVNATTARSTYDGTGISIAITDTGIDTSHPRLGGGGSPIFNSKVIGGRDTGDDDDDPRPASGGEAHGTACAGIAGGDTGTVGNYIGGVAPGAKLYALKISLGTSGFALDSDTIEAWEWVVTHQDDDTSNPIMIISHSFGGGRYTSNCDATLSSLTTAAASAVSAGITIFASSGNDGYCDSMGGPACISYINSVGAVYDDANIPYGFCVDAASCAVKETNAGCGTGWVAWDTVKTPDMVTGYSNSASFLTMLAPSNSAHTSDIVGTGGYNTDPSPDGDYTTKNAGFGGTSAACPYAAGSAAVLQSAAKALNGSFLTPSQVSTYLVDNGDNIADSKPSGITKPRVNVGNAVAALTCYEDSDHDGYGTSTIIADNGDSVCTAADGESDVDTDCNDGNAAIHPGATEIAGDSVDQDCNNQEICYADLDNDGYRPDASSTVISADTDCNDSTEALAAEPTGDCNDSNAAIHPGATEIAGDGVDQDCNNQEICYADLDNDGYRPDASSTVISADLDCSDSTEAVAADPTGDCNDNNATIHPGAVELVGDGVDQDCNGSELCYLDGDGDTYGTGSTVADDGDLICNDTGESMVSTDCNDGNAAIHPDAVELVGDGVDQDCNNQEICYADLDNDGYRPDASSTVISADTDCSDSTEAVAADPTGDCNDGNAAIHPSATEIVGDGVDQDCNNQEICYADLDNDGYRPDASSTVISADTDCNDSTEALSTEPVDDCNDANASIHPGATEVIGDGVDQDCNNQEICYADLDNDGYRPDDSSTVASADLDCSDSTEAMAADPTGDCNDSNAAIHPGATEIVGDGVDQDCNNQEICYADLDNDGYRPDASSTVISADSDCTDSTEAVSTEPTNDCDDSNPLVYPGATEIVADGIDQDCDSNDMCYQDSDGDTYGTSSTVIDDGDLVCDDTGESAVNTDCNDGNAAIHPAAVELIGDEIDQNCDSQELCYTDQDNDGYRPDGSSTTASTDLDCADSGEAIATNPTGDCNDNDAAVYPGAAETVGDGVDQDCDGNELCYQDNDGDSYGSSTVVPDNGNLICTDTTESNVSTDCNDDDPDINPGATEICDEKDNNCDSQIDENDVCSDGFWLLMLPTILSGGESPQ